jgi:hypothetical protein
MYSQNCTEPKAPEGMVRFLGKEYHTPFFIGDEPAPMTPQEIADIAHMHRGVGITISVYDDEGNLLHGE